MLASLERAGKDLTPAPPRWEGSGRISSVTDLCYLLRRTIQACACAVNSPSPLVAISEVVRTPVKGAWMEGGFLLER
jgi:hypothetical protein